MKKFLYLSLIFSLFFALSGCEKQDVPFLSNELTLKEVRREIASEDVVRKASFTTEGKIRNVTLGNISTTANDDVKREYRYTPENLLECIPGFSSSDSPGCYPFLEYDGGILIRLNGNTLEYNGNTIVEHRLNWDSRSIYTFEDETYQKLLKVELMADISTTPVLRNLETYEYEGDNVTYIESWRFNDTSGQLEIINTTSYTYDNQPNPYRKGHNQIAVVSYYHQMLYLSWDQWNLIYRSANNVIERTTTFNLQGWTGNTVTYDYEYNANGYPIKITEQSNLHEIVTKFEYYE